MEKLSDIAFSAKGDGDSSNLWSNKQATTVSHVSSKPGLSKLDAGVGFDPQRSSPNVGEKKPSGPFSSIQAVKGSPATAASSAEPVGTLIIENSNFRKGQGPQQQQPFERRSVGRDSLSSGPSPFDKNSTPANYSALDDKVIVEMIICAPPCPSRETILTSCLLIFDLERCDSESV